MAEYFKDLFSGIASVIEDISDNVSAYFKRRRVSEKIKETQKNKVNMFSNLGELVYNLHVNGVIDIEQCRGMCDEITAYNEKLKLLTDEEKVFKKGALTQAEAAALLDNDTAVCTDNEDDFAEPSTDL